ncbi:MAG: methyltransferase domain-containing protein [Planctomycetes bacterium]|nr:methyltransferase domain-containing protein [Planctomycetota bacterium]
MLKNLYYWFRYRLPAGLRLVAPNKVNYKSFSLKSDDEFARYNEARSKHPIKAILLEWLKHEALLGPKFTLLDIGCGPGVLTRTIFEDPELRDRVVYTGVDQSERALEYARRTFPQAKFEQRDVLERGLPEGTFDVVMINEVVEHMPDYEKAIDLAIAGGPKVFVLTAFAIMPEYAAHRVRWSPDGECYMNSYAWGRVQARLRKIAGNRPMLMADLGTIEFDRHWFPRKALSMFYLRLAGERATLYE